MRYLLENLIRSFGGSFRECGGMLTATFYDDDLAERCADEICVYFQDVTVEVDGECVLIWA
jgi:hypothetical protein